MTTYTEPTITVTDWRGDDVEHTMASYQETWESAKLREVTRLAMWQGEADDVVEMERLEREFAELRERIVRREFLSNFKRQHPEADVGANLLEALKEEVSL
jgi:hypothetical protein